jgi:hypothetical protein
MALRAKRLKGGPDKKAKAKKKSLGTPIPDVDEIAPIRPLPKVRPTEGNNMPWDSKSFQKHNKKLSESEAGKAARVANAVLEDSGDDGMAIAVANKQAAVRREGAGKGVRKSGRGGRPADFQKGLRVSP